MKIAIYIGRFPHSHHWRDNWRDGWRGFGFVKSRWSRTYVLKLVVLAIEVAFNPKMERLSPK